MQTAPQPTTPRTARLPRRYLRVLGYEVIGQMALMLLAVEALYLSDKMVTHLLFDTLRNQLGLGFLAQTLVLASPEILSVGLPLAVVIAVYLALLRRREAGDLVILAAAGVPPRALIGFCLLLGLVAMTLAGGLRGFVEPLAARHLTQRLIEAQFEAVRQGQLIEGRFLSIGSTTFYQQPQDRDGARSFVFLRPNPDQEQVLTAARTRLILDTGAASGALDLEGARIIQFSRTEGQTRTAGLQIAVERMRLGPVRIDLPGAPGPGETLRTATLPEVVRDWFGGNAPAGQVALERVLGMALALTAPLIAGLALAATRGPLRLAALPVALGAVLGGGLALSPGAALLGGLPPGAALASVAGLALALVALASALMARLLPGSVLPQGIRL